MNNKIITSSMIGLMLILTIIILWPRSKNIPLSADVEDAINSIDPLPADMTDYFNNEYHKITIGDFSRVDVRCAFPGGEERHVSTRGLKRKESAVIKRRDATFD